MPKIFLITALLTLLSCFSNGGIYSHKDLPGERFKSRVEMAAALKNHGKYQEAIDEYQKHFELRLKSSTRPESQNPYFYHILIGELYLLQGNTDKALSFYESAHKNHVEEPFVIDGYRRVAEFYAKTGGFTRAIELLEKHRDLDPLMFDSDIDHFHKQMILQTDFSTENQ